MLIKNKDLKRVRFLFSIFKGWDMMKPIILLSLFYAVEICAIHPKTTCDRIKEQGYPCETHALLTKDGYNLTMFRIPYSPNLNNQEDTTKSVVFLMHGLVSSSDCWVLNGPKIALMFLLSDAGYDVWSGNNRGNRYSQKHITKSPLFADFWEFSWHEIGTIDVPTQIDYILDKTGQKKLHYIGHSQGCTAFFVMCSSLQSYNSKIKTAHMLAPAIYMENMNLPLAKKLRVFGFAEPSTINNIISKRKFPPGDEIINLLLPPTCLLQPKRDLVCLNLIFFIGGGRSEYTDRDLTPLIVNTHPVDCSTRQFFHFLQEQKSKEFRRYDFGSLSNQLTYGSPQPPKYQLQNINPSTPIKLYYSDNDDWVATKDVDRLADEMGPKVKKYFVKYPGFNHIDFLWSKLVKEVINDCIIAQINENEGKAFTRNKCNNLST